MNQTDVMNHTDRWMGGGRDVGPDGSRHLVVVLGAGYYLQVVQVPGYDANCLASRAF
jgi:hypothetical protein